MGKATGSATRVCGFDHAKLVAFLRHAFPQHTAKSVAAALNISHRTAENWLSGVASPNFVAIGQMIDRWGAPFLAETMTNPPPFAVEAARAEEYADLKRKQEAIHAKYRTSAPD